MFAALKYLLKKGRVAEWLGRGLQNLVQRFKSARDLRFTFYFSSAFLIFECGFFSPSYSQDYPAKNIYRIFIEVNGQHSPERAFEDVSGLYGYSSMTAALNVPLISKVTEGKDFTKKLLGVTAKAKGEITLPKISFIKSDHLLLNLSGSLNVLYNGNKNTWQGTFTTSFAEDNYTIALPKIRFAGSFLFTRRASLNFAYTLGAAYSFVYGEGRFVPLIGSTVRIDADDRIAALFPMHISWIHTYSFVNVMRVYIAPSGGVNRFKNNDGLFPNAPDIIYFRRREFKAGVLWRLRPSPPLIISFGGGILLKRSIYFSEKNNSDYLLHQQPQPFWFAELGIKFRFGTKKLYEFMRPDELMFNETDFLNYLFDTDENQMPREIY
jgi:hypothetical protein